MASAETEVSVLWRAGRVGSPLGEGSSSSSNTQVVGPELGSQGARERTPAPRTSGHWAPAPSCVFVCVYFAKCRKPPNVY